MTSKVQKSQECRSLLNPPWSIYTIPDVKAPLPELHYCLRRAGDIVWSVHGRYRSTVKLRKSLQPLLIGNPRAGRRGVPVGKQNMLLLPTVGRK